MLQNDGFNIGCRIRGIVFWMINKLFIKKYSHYILWLVWNQMIDDHCTRVRQLYLNEEEHPKFDSS